MSIDRTVAPPVSDFGLLAVPAVETMRLSNGVLLHWLDNGSQPVCRLTLSWASGVAEETAPGSSQLMASLMSEGTAERTGAQISETLDFNGAWLRINSQYHHTTLSLFSLNSKLPEVLPLVGGIIMRPTFPANELRSLAQKQAAMLEISRRKVKTAASEMNSRLTLGDDHPLAQPILPEQVIALSREEVAKRHRDAIVAAPPRAYLTGRITPETLRLVVCELERLSFDSTVPAEPIVQTGKPRLEPTTLKKEVADSLQTAICMAIPTIPRSHPDYERLRIIVMALGGYFGSRLMQNIREDKGYTYGINAGLVGMREGSHVAITTECDNRYADAVVEEIEKEILRLSHEPMPDEELRIVRRTLMSTLAATLDTPFTIMDYHINLDTFAMPRDYFLRHQQAAMALTADEIMSLSERYLLSAPHLTSMAGHFA